MTITIDITNTECKIVDKLSIDQLAVIQEICSFKMEGSEYKSNAFMNKGIKWDGTKRLFNIQTQKFPIGLLSRVMETLQHAGIEIVLNNNRKILNTDVDYVCTNFGVREYQTSAVISSIMHGNGIVKVATGGGKTTIAARTIGALKNKAIFVVHTKDLLYQTKESFENIFPCEIIGQIGDGVIDYQNITVATIQSLSILGSIQFETYKYDEDSDNYKETIELSSKRASDFHTYRHSIGTVMFDEVQRICSRTAFSSRMLFDYANNAFGYSASPWRDDGSDLMIEAAFGKRIVDVTASELIDMGFLVKPIIDIYRFNTESWKGRTYEQIYKSAIVENDGRNMRIAMDAIEQYSLGRNTLILVTQIKHGEALETMIDSMGMPTVFISGKSGSKKRKQVISDMRSGKAQIVIASTIADVGLDVPRLQSIIEAGAGKSSVTALQRLGRIMRPFDGKDLCYFITYHDNVPYINTQIDKKVAIWSTEKNFVINRH